MNCERMETRLIVFLDGKATAAERREVEAHLESCADCRARAEEFRAVSALLDHAPVDGPSPAFDARMRAAVAAQPARGWFTLVEWGVPALRTAAALAVLALVAWWVAMLPTPNDQVVQMTPSEEFQLIRDLPVLEDYDVLANFEVLSQLPPPKPEKN